MNKCDLQWFTYLCISLIVCDEGWKNVDGRCYLYSKNFNVYDQTKMLTGELSYGQAVLECEKRGGKLLEPKDGESFNAIVKVTIALHSPFLHS